MHDGIKDMIIEVVVEILKCFIKGFKDKDSKPKNNEGEKSNDSVRTSEEK